LVLKLDQQITPKSGGSELLNLEGAPWAVGLTCHNMPSNDQQRYAMKWHLNNTYMHICIHRYKYMNTNQMQRYAMKWPTTICHDMPSNGLSTIYICIYIHIHIHIYTYTYIYTNQMQRYAIRWPITICLHMHLCRLVQNFRNLKQRIQCAASDLSCIL